MTADGALRPMAAGFAAGSDLAATSGAGIARSCLVSAVRNTRRDRLICEADILPSSNVRTWTLKPEIRVRVTPDRSPSAAKRGSLFPD